MSKYLGGKFNFNIASTSQKKVDQKLLKVGHLVIIYVNLGTLTSDSFNYTK